MNSALITILLVCLMVLDSATAQWEVSGGISTTNSGAVKAEVKVTFKWGKRKSRSTVSTCRWALVLCLVNNAFMAYNEPLLC